MPGRGRGGAAAALLRSVLYVYVFYQVVGVVDGVTVCDSVSVTRVVAGGIWGFLWLRNIIHMFIVLWLDKLTIGSFDEGL